MWRKEGHVAKNVENDPVINLLLSALSYQAFHIHKNIEQSEEKILREFRDRIIPFHLIKPVPAFSIIETKMLKSAVENMVDASSLFEFKRSKFLPLLETKVINAEVINVNQYDKNINLKLKSESPLESLSGVSFYIDTTEPVNIMAIKYGDYELPLIKPASYNELPFVKYFNNAHLFLNQNYYLFGTYDYWQEIYLTNTTQLYHIGQYDTKKISFNGQSMIELEIVLSSFYDISDKIKINCIPIVNVEKKEITLNNRNPVQELYSTTGEFLNLLFDKDNEKYLDEYMDSFLIRQHGVERYNSKQLLEQMNELLYRYDYDYYAIHSIGELKNSSKLKELQEIVAGIFSIVNKFEEQRFNARTIYEHTMKIMDEVSGNVNKSEEHYNLLINQIEAILEDISGIVDKFENESVKERFYAILKKNDAENKNVHIEYLTTSGAAANGLKKGEKATRAPNFLERGKTALLIETKGGRNSIKNEMQKENIAKYYFQTKDRLITVNDIRAFIRTYYYNEKSKLDIEIDNITIKRESNYISISITLKEDSLLKNADTLESLATTLQNKITYRSTGILPFKVSFV